MSYQAGSRSFSVPTGADTRIALRFHRAQGYAAAADLVAGTDFVIYLEHVWPVFSVTPVGATQVQVRLGGGSAFDPNLTLGNDDLVPIAVPAVWEDADMQVMMPASCYWPAPTTRSVPTQIDTDPTVLLILIDQEWLEVLQSYIDYSEGGPSGLSLPYDLVGTFDGSRTRVLTGSLNVVRSAASPVVGPLPPVGPLAASDLAVIVGTVAAP